MHDICYMLQHFLHVYLLFFFLCLNYRARLRRIVTTHRFQVLVVSLVIVDCIVVIAELLFDLKILGLLEDATSSLSSKGRAGSSRNTNGSILNQINVSGSVASAPAEENYFLIPDILHSVSVAILSLMVLESFVKIIAFGFAFLRLGWEIFDVVVVAVTFSLDVVLQHSHSVANGFGLIIILRLWRVARILNGIFISTFITPFVYYNIITQIIVGMVKSVKKAAVRRVECEKRRREALEDQVVHWRRICYRQKETIVQLENLLNRHGLVYDVSNLTQVDVIETRREQTDVDHCHHQSSSV